MRQREASQPLEPPSRSLYALLKELLTAPSDYLLNSQILKRAQQLGTLDGRHVRAGAAAARKHSRLSLIDGELGCRRKRHRRRPYSRSLSRPLQRRASHPCSQVIDVAPS